MKTLSDYIGNEFSTLLDKYDAFFAFGDEQFEEQRKAGEKYVSLFAGLICPVANSKKLLDDYNEVVNNAIRQDKQENRKEDIILRELWNYEAFYSSDIDDAWESLKRYNYTREDIFKVYKKNYHEAVEKL